MNDKLQKENTDLKWQVENLEDEKKTLEDEIQSGKERIAELNGEIVELEYEIDRMQKAAAVQSGQIRKLQTANVTLSAAANYWRKESKNSRHYVRKCERIIAELVDNGQ
jgi:chromosome segregation ATPase